MNADISERFCIAITDLWNAFLIPEPRHNFKKVWAILLRRVLVFQTFPRDHCIIRTKHVSQFYWPHVESIEQYFQHNNSLNTAHWDREPPTGWKNFLKSCNSSTKLDNSIADSLMGKFINCSTNIVCLGWCARGSELFSQFWYLLELWSLFIKLFQCWWEILLQGFQNDL